MNRIHIPSLLVAAFFSVLASPAKAVPATSNRPDAPNRSGTDSAQSGAVTFAPQGHIFDRSDTAAPGNADQRLAEATFGTAFATWTPTSSHALDVAAAVRAALYPPVTQTRDQIENSIPPAPFRYKFLLYDQEGTDITQDFENIDQWFTQADKDAIAAQVVVLRDALARSPFDTDLRNLYLEIFYDLLVAEVQSVKKKLVEVGKKRLGLETASLFIIDDEIELYEEIVSKLSTALDTYGDALAEGMDGIDPADFDADPERVGGMPFGLYVFIKQQPRRNQTPARFASSSTTGLSDVADEYPLDDDPLPDDPNNPEDLVLSGGYKDYNNLLTVMAAYARHSAELARLRGMRQAPGDLTMARSAIAEIQSDIADDYCFLSSQFADIEFLPGDTSGVRGSMADLERSIADAENVRAFLNGEANLLGLDPEFLLIVPSDGTKFDSYDILADQVAGANGPLEVALDALRGPLGNPELGARSLYENYRTSLDNVVEELGDYETSFALRHSAITGFTPDEEPGFNGSNPKPGSELRVALQNITRLRTRLGLFNAELAAQQQNRRIAAGAVSAAAGIADSIRDATTVYDQTQSNAYDELHVVEGLAAGSQAAAEGVYAVSGAAANAGPGAPGAAAVAVSSSIAAVANTVVQTSTAVLRSQREEDLDRAATSFQSQLALAEAPLAVAQARLALGEQRRATFSLRIEQQGDLLALSQAQAEVVSLHRELRRIRANRDSNVGRIRGKFFADPIHLVRADNAILKADAAFRNAQRWVFYTQRALEYKWSEQFAHAFLGKSFDSGSIFKMRNAEELDELLDAMADWDAIRNSQSTLPQQETITISLRDHVLAINPEDSNRLFPSFGLVDDLLRVDVNTNEVVTQAELFERKLQALTDGEGNLVIPFDTSLLENLGSRFFRGPNYSTGSPGTYRDKVEWFAINIVSPQGSPGPDQDASPGSMDYSGLTFFRTRIPPRVDRSQPANLNQGGVIDLPGEFITSVFRRPVSLNFDNVFEMRTDTTTSIGVAVNQASARENPAVRDTLANNPNFRQTAFKEYSVAATGWILELDASSFPVKPDGTPDITDVEIIVQHRSTDRVPTQ